MRDIFFHGVRIEWDDEHAKSHLVYLQLEDGKEIPFLLREEEEELLDK